MVPDGTGSVYDDTGWYLVSISWYWLDIRWYMVSKGLVCLYILEKVEIWSGDTDAWHTDSLTHRQQNIELLSLYKISCSSWVTECKLYLLWVQNPFSPLWKWKRAGSWIVWCSRAGSLHFPRINIFSDSCYIFFNIF